MCSDYSSLLWKLYGRIGMLSAKLWGFLQSVEDPYSLHSLNWGTALLLSAQYLFWESFILKIRTQKVPHIWLSHRKLRFTALLVYFFFGFLMEGEVSLDFISFSLYSHHLAKTSFLEDHSSFLRTRIFFGRS